MRHYDGRIAAWMWRRVETAAIVTAMGWTWMLMSRPRNDVAGPRRPSRHRVANRVFDAVGAEDDPDGGQAWERRRRRRLIDG